MLHEFLLSTICATCPSHLILHVITLKYLVKQTSYETPCYVAFSSLSPLSPREVQIQSETLNTDYYYYCHYHHRHHFLYHRFPFPWYFFS